MFWLSRIGVSIIVSLSVVLGMCGILLGRFVILFRLLI
nr:MAG TPA: hypothetical protein [Caudoviricetes sp.]